MFLYILYPTSQLCYVFLKQIHKQLSQLWNVLGGMLGTISIAYVLRKVKMAMTQRPHPSIQPMTQTVVGPMAPPTCMSKCPQCIHWHVSELKVLRHRKRHLCLNGWMWLVVRKLFECSDWVEKDYIGTRPFTITIHPLSLIQFRAQLRGQRQD